MKASSGFLHLTVNGLYNLQKALRIEMYQDIVHPKPHTKEPVCRLNRSHNSHEPLPGWKYKKQQTKRLMFELPTSKEPKSLTLSPGVATNQSIKDSVRVNVFQLDQIKKAYSNVSEERRKYIDIIEWLKHTLGDIEVRLDQPGCYAELKGIYSTAVGEMVREFRIESVQKSRLLKLVWDSVIGVCGIEVKEMEQKLSTARKDVEQKYLQERIQYDKQVKEYRETIIRNAAQLAKKQRFFYEVVTDNRILRSRVGKMMVRLKHQLQSNSYLKEENVLFYKQNQKMKMVLDSEDFETKYKVLQDRFSVLDKQLSNQKRKVTKVNIIRELKEEEMRSKLGIKREVDEILRKVAADDLLDLEIVEAPRLQELTRLYYSAGVQAEPQTQQWGTNTTNVFYGKKAVATQCFQGERTKYFSIYKCDDYLFEGPTETEGVELLAAYRQKNKQLKGDIQYRQQALIKVQTVNKSRSSNPGNRRVARRMASIINESKGRTSQMKSFMGLDLSNVIQDHMNKKALVEPIQHIESSSEDSGENEDKTEIRKSRMMDKPRNTKSKIINMHRSSLITEVDIFSGQRKSDLKRIRQIDPVSFRNSKGSKTFRKSQVATLRDMDEFEDLVTPYLQQNNNLPRVDQMLSVPPVITQDNSKKAPTLEAKQQTPNYDSLQVSQSNAQQSPQSTFRQTLQAESLKSKELTPEQHPLQTSSTTRLSVNIKTKKQSVVKSKPIESQKNPTNESKPIETQRNPANGSKPSRTSTPHLPVKSGRQKLDQKVASPNPKVKTLTRSSKQTTSNRTSQRQDYIKKSQAALQKPDPKKQKSNPKKQKSDPKKLSGKAVPNNGVQNQVSLPQFSSQEPEYHMGSFGLKRSILKIEERQSQQDLESETNVRKVGTSPIHRVSLNFQKRHSKFSSSNECKDSDREILNPHPIAESSSDDQETERHFQVTGSHLTRTVKRVNRLIMRHKDHLLRQQISFEQFIDSEIDHSYGIKTLSFNIKQKLKEALRQYKGDSPDKLACQALLHGCGDQNSLPYKRYLFLIYIVTMEFWSMYQSVEDFNNLLVEFVKDLLSNFSKEDLVEQFTNSTLMQSTISNGNQLFLRLKSFLDGESTDTKFQQLVQVVSCIFPEDTMTMEDVYDLFAIISDSKNNLFSFINQASLHTTRKNKTVPFFKVVMALKRVEWKEGINFCHTLKEMHDKRFGISAQENYDQSCVNLLYYLKSNRYLEAFLSQQPKQRKKGSQIMYHLVKLQHSNQVMDQVTGDIIGQDLMSLSQTLMDYSLKDILSRAQQK